MAKPLSQEQRREWKKKLRQQMVFKLSMEAEKKRRRLRGSMLIPKVVSGVKFKDGEEVKQAA